MELLLNGPIEVLPQSRPTGDQKSPRLYVPALNTRRSPPLRALLAGLACLALSAMAIPATAAPVATVEGVQWPAWIERAGRRQPVAPGIAVQGEDRLVTGSDGRLLLRLVDGSALKLGADAQLRIASLAKPDKDLLAGALEVVRGAFRFTTGVFAKTSHRRDLNVKVSALTIGIRGTDVWGKAADGRDLVLLLEGEVSVAHGETSTALTTSLTYLSSTAGAAPEQFTADAAQAAAWAAETEIDAKRPAGQVKGKFNALLATFDDEAAALDGYDRVRALGYAGRLRVIEPFEMAPSVKEPVKAATASGAEMPAASAEGGEAGTETLGRRYLLRVEGLASRQQAAVVQKVLRDALR